MSERETRSAEATSSNAPSSGAQDDSSTEPATPSPEPGQSADAGAPSDNDDLGPYPFAPSTLTSGGTMTFTNVGAPGWWPRRLDRPAGDPACTYKDGTDTWGGGCCMTEHHSESSHLAPFDEEMTLVLKALVVKQLAVYQPASAGGEDWRRVTSYDDLTDTTENLWFTQKGTDSDRFPGNLTQNDCVGYLSQAPTVDCGSTGYYCPDDPGVLHHGFEGSKLVVFLGSMSFSDGDVLACDGGGVGHPGPWVAFVNSELIRDGGRKWNGACNCYSKTGSVGDGCGEINLFEVVMDGNEFSNREFASTGVRSYQAGHVGGAVCKSDCSREMFAPDAEVVDACGKRAYEHGPELEVGGSTTGCPVWRRPQGDRYFFVLLDEARRVIQVGIVHPGNIPPAAAPLLPRLPKSLPRAVIDALVDLRLPEANSAPLGE